MTNEKKTRDLQGEVWRVIEGFPRYQISNKGRVKSLVNPRNPKILKQGTMKRGYKSVTLMKGDEWGSNVRISQRVHRLVAQAFIPNSELKPQINHIDCNPANNNVENLEWVTPIENANHPLTREHMLAKRGIITEKCSRAVYVYDNDFNLLSAFTSTADAARKTDSSQGNIACCVNGYLDKYKGLIWSYNKEDTPEKRRLLEESATAKKKARQASITKAYKKIYPKLKEEGRLWYQTHPEQSRERSRNYYHSHKEQIKESIRKHRNAKEDIGKIQGTP